MAGRGGHTGRRESCSSFRPPQAVLRRPGKNLLAPLPIGNLSLGLTRVVSDSLAAVEPDAHARCLELTLPLEDPETPLRELVPDGLRHSD